MILKFHEWLNEGSIKIDGNEIKDILFDNGMSEKFGIPLLWNKIEKDAIEFYKLWNFLYNSNSELKWKHFFNDIITSSNYYFIHQNFEFNKMPYVINFLNHNNLEKIKLNKLHKLFMNIINNLNESLFTSINFIISNYINKSIDNNIKLIFTKDCKTEETSYFINNVDGNFIFLCYFNHLNLIELNWKTINERITKRITNNVNDNIKIIFEIFIEEILSHIYAFIYDSIIHELTHYYQTINDKSTKDLDTENMKELDYLNLHYELGATITYFYNLFNSALINNDISILDKYFSNKNFVNIFNFLSYEDKKIYAKNYPIYKKRYDMLTNDNKKKFWKYLYDLIYNKINL